MDWPDDKFEAYLRQFRPSKPKALATHRRMGVPLAIAAIIVVAVGITTQYELKAPAVNNATHTPESTPPASANSAQAMSQGGRAKELRSLPLSGPIRTPIGAGNRRLRVGGAVKPPVKLVDAKPIYPEDAQAAGIQGVVILGIVIAEDGSVIETSVLRSIPELNQAAIDAVGQWQYETTLLNGEPVEIEMNVAINFTL